MKLHRDLGITGRRHCRKDCRGRDERAEQQPRSGVDHPSHRPTNAPGLCAGSHNLQHSRLHRRPCRLSRYPAPSHKAKTQRRGVRGRAGAHKRHGVILVDDETRLSWRLPPDESQAPELVHRGVRREAQRPPARHERPDGVHHARGGEEFSIPTYYKWTAKQYIDIYNENESLSLHKWKSCRLTANGGSGSRSMAF